LSNLKGIHGGPGIQSRQAIGKEYREHDSEQEACNPQIEKFALGNMNHGNHAE